MTHPALLETSHRVLLIDDNRAIHEDFGKILGGDVRQLSALNESRAALFGEEIEESPQAVFALDSAHQGEEGVAMLLHSIEQGRPYSMAFIDMRMPPGIDGLETAARLWKIDPELQIVVCTAFSDYSWKETVEKLGNSDRLLILKKPFETIEVLQLAHALTAKWALSHILSGRLADLKFLVAERTRDLETKNQQLQDEIAERTRAEVRIREQATLLDEAQDAIIVRGLDDAVLYWNASAERLYGWPAAEAMGRPVTELIHAHSATFLEARRVVLETGAWIGELQHHRQDGRALTVEGHWTLVRDAEGAPKSILTINTDITERNLLKDQLTRAQRMESLGRLAGGIAHDLNNTLSPISVAVDLLRAKIDLPSNLKISRILEILETSGRRSTELVRQLLSFARGSTGDRTALQPGDLIHEVQQVAAATFSGKFKIQTELAPELGTVLGDAKQLHQVLLDLCTNARDAMPTGGPITVTASAADLDEADVSMNYEANAGPYVILEVRDTGTGIPADVLEKIFDPFFTTKELGRNTGLGLSTSLGIVKSHGGFLRVSSEVGHGTSIQVYLPAEGSPRAAAPGVPVPELIRGLGEWVLIVDDEATFRTMAKQILEASGYRVLTAGEGTEAIAIYAARQAEIAVVLIDMMMPVMDGAATIAVLQRINPEVKIITSSGFRPNAQKAGDPVVNALRFLAKPYRAEGLLRSIAEELGVIPAPGIAPGEGDAAATPAPRDRALAVA